MKPVGTFQVVGPGAYRGHPVGAMFASPVNRPAVARALQRGNITLVEMLGGGLPGRYTLPRGWGQ